MYTIHLRLIGKRVVDFLLVLIELFLIAVTVSFNQRYKCARCMRRCAETNSHFILFSEYFDAYG